MRTDSVIVDVSDWMLLAKSEYKKTYPFSTLMHKNAIRVLEHRGQLYHFKPPHKLMMFLKGDAVWKDLIASYIGKMMDIDVPQTWLALDYRLGKSNCYGILTKWFYDPKGQKVESGKSILQRLIPHYQRRKHHNLETVLKYAQSEGIMDGGKVWGKIMLFDMIIGNSNRTDSNWEIIHIGKDNKKFGPAFDNSISFLTHLSEKGMVNWTLDNMFHRIARSLYFHRKAKRFRLSIQPSLYTERFNIQRALAYIIQHRMLTPKEAIDILDRLDIATLSAWIAISRQQMNREVTPEYRLDDRVAQLLIDFVRHRKFYLLKHLTSIQAGQV